MRYSSGYKRLWNLSELLTLAFIDVWTEMQSHTHMHTQIITVDHTYTQIYM